MLDFLPPAMPIVVCNCFSAAPQPCFPISLEDGSQIIAAIEQRDRVEWIHLEALPSSLSEKLATIMQETFPTLKYLLLWAGDEPAPILPEGFLGGSAPKIQTFWLKGIPFPETPQLLLSMDDLVHFRLEKIPDSGYISPEAMITAVTECTKLETLIIEFLSGDPHPDLTNQEITSLARAFFPSLTLFGFSGNGRYFDNFVPRIESPFLGLNDDIRHDTNISENRHVFYEKHLTSSGLSFRYHSQLRDPVVIVED